MSLVLRVTWLEGWGERVDLLQHCLDGHRPPSFTHRHLPLEGGLCVAFCVFGEGERGLKGGFLSFAWGLIRGLFSIFGGGG